MMTKLTRRDTFRLGAALVALPFTASIGRADGHATAHMVVIKCHAFIPADSRECLATVVDTSLSGHRVARELDRIAEMRGFHCTLVSDNGTEMTSNAMLKGQEQRQVEWHCIAPGKPMQNT